MNAATATVETRQMMCARLRAESAEGIRMGNELLERLAPNRLAAYNPAPNRFPTNRHTTKNAGFAVVSLQSQGNNVAGKRISKWNASK